MNFEEIITLILSLTLIIYLIGIYIYKKKTNKPTGECCYCKSGLNRALKKINKELKK